MAKNTCLKFLAREGGVWNCIPSMEAKKVLPIELTSLENVGFQLPRLWDPGIKIFH